MKTESDDQVNSRLIYGIFCRSSCAGFHKWLWINPPPKSIKDALHRVRFPVLYFSFNPRRPRSSNPVPVDWFRKEIHEQIELGFKVELIYPSLVDEYTFEAIKRKDAKYDR